MENKKFEVGDFWRDSDGFKHQIMEIGENYVRTYRYKNNKERDGYGHGKTFNRYGYSKNDLTRLIELWKEPRSGEVWANIYEDKNGRFYTGLAYLNEIKGASPIRGDKYIARIKMPWKEGQFDGR
jgi:hypothetical protein